MVAVVVGGLSYWAIQRGVEEIEENSARIQEAGIKKEVSEIDTSNWKTYVNEKYGYSLKVPEGWEEIRVNSKSIIFKKTFKEFSPQVKVEGEVIVDVFSNEEKLSLRDWIDKNDQQEESSVKSIKETELGGYKGLKRIIVLELDGLEYKDIYIQIDNLIYDIQPNVLARFPDEQLEKEYVYLISQSNQTIEKVLETLNFSR